MTHVETYIMPVPKAQLEGYFNLARQMLPLWKEFGVMKVTELRPMDVPMGKLTSFPQAVMATADETVVMGMMQFRDKAHRDASMEAAMADERMQALFQKMPVDGKRMIWACFTTEIEA
jgi:uncharacterized protein YbaA (DUF1428 family)